MRWFDPSWNCYNWQVHLEVYAASDQVKIGLLRGYCDADGSPVFNRGRKRALVHASQIIWTNLFGLRRHTTAIKLLAKSYQVLAQCDNSKNIWQICGQKMIAKCFSWIFT